jgi:hypothetical protein
MTPGLVGLVAYLALQLGIGVWISKRIRTEADYLLAGRSLGYTLATFSIFATWFGSETVMGSAGNAFRDGISLANAEPFGYGLCLILMGLIFAGPLWRRRLTTLADLFRQRYSVKVERLAAVILIPGSILWAAAQIGASVRALRRHRQYLDRSGDRLRRGFTMLIRSSVGCWPTPSPTSSGRHARRGPGGRAGRVLIQVHHDGGVVNALRGVGRSICCRRRGRPPGPCWKNGRFPSAVRCSPPNWSAGSSPPDA